MTEVLLDARTINAVLEALNQPVANATQACAIVRILAREGGLEIAEDREIAGGDFNPCLDRGSLVARAIQAIEDVENWCHVNEANWTGWGEQIVPEGAIRWTTQAKMAQSLIRDMIETLPDDIIDRRVVAEARRAVLVPSRWGHGDIGDRFVRYLKNEITADRFMTTCQLDFPELEKDERA